MPHQPSDFIEGIGLADGFELDARFGTFKIDSIQTIDQDYNFYFPAKKVTSELEDCYDPAGLYPGNSDSWVKAFEVEAKGALRQKYYKMQKSRLDVPATVEEFITQNKETYDKT